MSAKKFKFVSPGVFLSEIDQSQLPKEPGGVGPAIIGRTRRGPALKPVKVNSFQEFVEIFGEPVPGNEGDDPWRDGNGLLAPAYAPYAAQAYLKADINSPVTVVRLLGVAGDDSDGNDPATPGWDVSDAYGIFLFPSGAIHSGLTGSLGAIIYGQSRDATDGLRTVGLAVDSESDVIGSEFYAKEGGTGASTLSFNSRFKKFANDKVTLLISGSNAGVVKKSISFRPGSGDYIRDVLNTNPVATNTEIATAPSGTLANCYFLGESFEEEYERVYTAGNGNVLAAVVKLHENMTDFKSSKHEAAAAQSGWVIPQYLGAPESFNTADLERMFRFVAIQEGEQGMDIHVKIENVKIADEGNPSPYGTFDVVVCQRRGIKLYNVDSYENLNLNPNSDNFIARRIGDQFFQWDAAQKRNRVYGDHPNQSSYIRVEMGTYFSETGKVSSNPKHVPFGYLGPVVPVDLTGDMSNTTSSYAAEGWVNGSISHGQIASQPINLRWPEVPHVVTASQGLDLVAKYSFGHSAYQKKKGTRTESLTEVNLGIKDYLRRYSTFGHLTDQLDGVADGSTTKHSYVFTFDEVVVTGSKTLSSDLSEYVPSLVSFNAGSHVATRATAVITVAGNPDTDETFTLTDALGSQTTFTFSRANATVNGNSIGIQGVTGNFPNIAARIQQAIEASGLRVTAVQSGATVTITQTDGGARGNKALDVTGVLGLSVPNNKFVDGTDALAYTANYSGSSLMSLVNSFAMPLHGGFDGVDITEADPFNMSARAVGPDSTTRSSYAHASVDRAIELIRDPEMLEMNLAAMPGITNTVLTRKLVQTCEARGDALAIIDLPDVYIPPSEAKCTSFKDRVDNTNPEKSAKALTKRQLNSSYGAAYYPWVKVRDTINARDQWVPPSVIALGVMGYTEQRDEVWFAPAGFNRGGLNEGNAGLPVLQVSEQLLSSQRDKLYEANINPIASFVSEGLVVFGQKTLQMTPSALDRINVRRLLIFVKKEVSRIANGLLFDQNVPATWNRFTGQVVPFLESVKTRLGLTDFKVVLDKTTTTPDLVDRNIMYAKIFLKPARAIEFIAVDFVITRSGASFDD